MSLPYFPMFPTDFEAKTSHLTLAEDGAYNRLLRMMWMTPGCSLPDDDAWIMRRMRVDAETYRTVVAPIIAEFCKRENGRVSNAKLSRIFEETNAAHKKRVLAGSKGGQAKALKTNKTRPSNAQAMLKQPEPEPEPEVRDSKESLGDTAKEAVSLFNDAAARVGWPRVQKLTKARRSSLLARLRDVGGLDGWRDALAKAEASPFLTGTNDKGWRADFDFMVRESSFTKLMEGRYDQSSRATVRHADANIIALAAGMRRSTAKPEF